MAKNVEKNLSVVSLTEEQLDALAQAGTKEAIAQIEAYIEAEQDFDKKEYAKMSLFGCELFYYQPTNDKEEEEFTLCELIYAKQKDLDELYIEAEDLEADVNEYSLEKKVHAKVLAAHKDKAADWKDYCLDESVISDKNEIAEIKDEIAYEEAWIAEAKKMITTKRYVGGIPERHLSMFDFNDDEDFDEDFGDCDGCSDGCYGDDCDDDCCEDGCCGDDCCGDDCCDDDSDCCPSHKA